ncbi:MAG: hypothetical protein F4064_15585 [Acidimicrobiales bacterium]|nr:hypothetical protein [Acidimicrobiales bacterium]
MTPHDSQNPPFVSHTLFEVLEADTEYRAYIMGAYQYCGDDVNCTDTHEGRIHTVSDATRESAIITFRTPRSRPLFAPATPGTVRQMILRAVLWWWLLLRCWLSV